MYSSTMDYFNHATVDWRNWLSSNSAGNATGMGYYDNDGDGDTSWYVSYSGYSFGIVLGSGQIVKKINRRIKCVN